MCHGLVQAGGGCPNSWIHLFINLESSDVWLSKLLSLSSLPAGCKHSNTLYWFIYFSAASTLELMSFIALKSQDVWFLRTYRLKVLTTTRCVGDEHFRHLPNLINQSPIFIIISLCLLKERQSGTNAVVSSCFITTRMYTHQDPYS